MRLGETLGLVVNAARPDGVDVAPIALRLRMDQRIAVALRGRGEEEGRLLRLGQAERVVRAVRADLQRRDRVLEVIDRAGRRGEVEDVMHFVRQEDEIRDVVLDELVVSLPARCSMFAAEPVMKLSMPMTRKPSARRRSVR